MNRANEEIVGVILAAGKGSRMSRLPTRLPKTVLPILGEPILYHQLRTMAELGIRTAHIVVGHLGFEVVREIERMPPLGMEIDYVDQKETLGIAHCVGRLEGRVDRPFLLCLGDIYFDAPRIGEMLRVFREEPVDGVLGAILEDDEEALRKNYCILTDDTGRATRVIEKPRHPQSRLKGVGVYLFAPHVFDAIRRTPRTAMRDEYEITDSIQIFIDDGYHVRACDCVEADLNVTYPRDLLDINLGLLARSGRDRLIGDGTEMGDGARVERSIVGAGARIGAGARLTRSLVFAGASVREGARLDRAIVTESDVLNVTTAEDVTSGDAE